MIEYGFQVKGSAVSGGTVRLTNSGKEIHMIVMGRLKPGKKATDILPALQIEDEEASQKAFDEVVEEVEAPSPQGLFGPGSVDVPVSVDPGSYALMCFIPTVDDAIPHAAKGMINEMKVEEGEAETQKPDATYQVTPGKATTGPETLTKGRHVIQVDAAAGSDDLEPILVRLDDGKTFGDMFAAVNGLFGEDPPKKGYLDEWPGELPFALSDFGGREKVSVAVDLEPGTYVLMALDTDADEPSPDAPEQITIKVS
jgi:hypothetical protein